MVISSNAPALVAQRLSKTFPPLRRREQATPVLREISLAVRSGEMISIVGPSGSGKSTLLYCLAGLERPTSGEVQLLGYPLGKLGATALAKLRRDHVGFIFQQFNLVGSLTALDNVMLPARLAGRAVDRRVAGFLLDQVGLRGRHRHRPAELSGGQQQRVAIARVLATQPNLIFADEPTGSLDTASGAMILGQLRDLTSEGRTVVLVTHDLEAAARADRVLVLRDGSLHSELRFATPDEVLAAVSSAAGNEA